MLVLTRKPGQTITLGGHTITITIIKTQSGRVRVGIDAPREVKILRGELAKKGVAA